MAVATYFYYEKVRRRMRTAIVTYLFKVTNLKVNLFKQEFNNELV